MEHTHKKDINHFIINHFPSDGKMEMCRDGNMQRWSLMNIYTFLTGFNFFVCDFRITHVFLLEFLAILLNLEVDFIF